LRKSEEKALRSQKFGIQLLVVNTAGTYRVTQAGTKPLESSLQASNHILSRARKKLYHNHRGTLPRKAPAMLSVGRRTRGAPNGCRIVEDHQ